MFRVVIPARYASTRFSGKALAPIGGRPMVQWVYERAQRSRADEVWIATDDERIAAAARGFGAPVAMTSADHVSGTDRIAELARQRGWVDRDIVVNVQGDEPLMPPALIDAVAAALESDPAADISTAACPIGSLAELMDPNVVKVVLDITGRALYFSRAPIPWDRDGAPAGLASRTSFAGALRHIGIYGYRVGALRRLATLAPTALEQREKLEQLRALEHGFALRVIETREHPGADVNTPDDLERVARLLGVQPR
jgi:3-deoxy-manno-octulosonate cytidylyltransferase (CMP-KDO synthetase)